MSRIEKVSFYLIGLCDRFAESFFVAKDGRACSFIIKPCNKILLKHFRARARTRSLDDRLKNKVATSTRARKAYNLRKALYIIRTFITEEPFVLAMFLFEKMSRQIGQRIKLIKISIVTYSRKLIADYCV